MRSCGLLVLSMLMAFASLAASTAAAASAVVPERVLAPRADGPARFTGSLERVHVHRRRATPSPAFWAIVTKSAIVPVSARGRELRSYENHRVSARGRIVRGVFHIRELANAPRPRAAAAPPPGPRRMAIVLIYPSDEVENFNEPVITAGAFDAGTANSVTSYYNTATYGRITFPGTSADVFGPIAVNPAPPSGQCGLLGYWPNEAGNVITQTRPNFYSEYQHFVYVVGTARCSSYSSSGSQGGGTVFLNGYGNLVLEHELGHNLGLYHAGTVRCDTGGGAFVTWTPGCDATTNPTYTEYQDPFDPMGGNTFCQQDCDMTATRKHLLGALGADGTQVVQYRGTYSLTPLETAAGVRLIRIASGSGRYLDFSLRRQLGPFDVGLPASATGVYVHSSPLGDDDTTMLLDAHPMTSFGTLPWYGATAFNDAAFQAGESFKFGSVSVTVGAVSDAGTTLTVAGLPDAPPATPPASSPAPKRGTARADTFRGTAGNDTYWGLGGNDIIFGKAGADVLVGGAGNDKIDGGPGSDTLRGDGGNDRLVGGKGKDNLRGGAGKDDIRGNDGSGGDKLTCGDGFDIAHFDPGDRVARDCERRIPA